MKKRFLNLFLALVMVAFVVPTWADAATTCYHDSRSKYCTVEKVDAKAATCTEAGYEEHFYCTFCKEEMKLNGKIYEKASKTIIPAGHKYVSGVCTECGDCEDNHVHNKVVTAAKAATCVEAGAAKTVYQCNDCGIYFCNGVFKETNDFPENVIPATGVHDYAYVSMVHDATCQEPRLNNYKCKNCDATKQDTTGGLLACNIVDLEAVAPTCLEKGKTAGKMCTTCGSNAACAYCKEITVLQTDVDALGHDVQIKEGSITKEATCDEAGECYYKCTRCGYGYPGTIAKLGHKDVETVIKDATCLKDGVKYVECERCGDYSLKVIPATGHTEEIVPAVAATCTATGLTEGKKCSVCGETLLAQVVTSMIAHDFSVDGPEKPVSCTEDGYTAHKKCAHCDATEGKEEIDTDGHVFENYICKVCGQRDGSCEHKNRVMKYTAPSCTDAGSQSFWCPDCNYESMEILPKLDHQKVDKSVAGTCITKGREHVVCTQCNQDLVNKETDYGTHKYENNQCVYCGAVDPDSVCKHTNGYTTETEAPTCTQSGTITTRCGDCGAIVDTSTIPATGHSYNNGVCTSCGKRDSGKITSDYQDFFVVGGPAY